MSHVYSDAPPPYAPTAASSNTLSVPNANANRQPKTRNGISINARRSMEDEQRPVPKGWVRQFDQESNHQFYVDTTVDPPRSIWHHPYDDDRYLSTLSSEERERIQHEHPTPTDMGHETTDDEDDFLPSVYDDKVKAAKGSAGVGSSSHAAASSSSSKPASTTSSTGKPSLGRRLKDKLTSSTHEEREAERKQRAIDEQRAYEMHQRVRTAMAKAQQTGQPQLLGIDAKGKEVYVQPPSANAYGGGAYGGSTMYNPYGQGRYGYPNAGYMRPSMPYGRPMGMGYGGGYGLPLAGGLMGGMLLGGMLGGF